MVLLAETPSCPAAPMQKGNCYALCCRRELRTAVPAPRRGRERHVAVAPRGGGVRPWPLWKWNGLPVADPDRGGGGDGDGAAAGAAVTPPSSSSSSDRPTMRAGAQPCAPAHLAVAEGEGGGEGAPFLTGRARGGTDALGRPLRPAARHLLEYLGRDRRAGTGRPRGWRRRRADH